MNCPPEDDPTNLIFYPSKTRCDTYYFCQGGEPRKLKCAPGLHWNRKTNKCDSPENAKCEVVLKHTYLT